VASRRRGELVAELGRGLVGSASVAADPVHHRRGAGGIVAGLAVVRGARAAIDRVAEGRGVEAARLGVADAGAADAALTLHRGARALVVGGQLAARAVLRL